MADKLFGAFQRLHAAHEFEGTGIGLATAQLLSEHGAKVVINDVDKDAAEEAAGKLSGETAVYGGDLTKESAPQELVDTAINSWGKLDIIVNNTDRKSGHCLLVPANGTTPASVWGIDQGLCFAPEYKLRTVIWEFGGESIPDEMLEAVAKLCERVPIEISALLNDAEVEAIQGRAAWCVKQRVFPTDPSGRRYPWPLV